METCTRCKNSYITYICHKLLGKQAEIEYSNQLKRRLNRKVINIQLNIKTWSYKKENCYVPQ